MPIGALHEFVFDCPNPEALARFWQALIGGEVDVEGDDWATLDGEDDGFFFGFQRSGDRKNGKNQVRLHVEVDQLEPAIDQAEQLGARKLGGVVEDDETGTYQEMADPAGNEFSFLQA